MSSQMPNTVGSHDPKSRAPGAQFSGKGMAQSLLQNSRVSGSVHRLVSLNMPGGGTSHPTAMSRAFESLYAVTAGKDMRFSMNTKSFFHSAASETSYFTLGLDPGATHFWYSDWPRVARASPVICWGRTVICESSSMASMRLFRMDAVVWPFVASTWSKVTVKGSPCWERVE